MRLLERGTYAKDEWLRDKPPPWFTLRHVIGFVIVVAWLTGLALALLWLNDWWPAQLIPFVPAERI